MVTITLGVAMFTFTIVSLVGLLMVARKQLVATGDVSITINDGPDKCLHTSAGGTLLGTLAANKIFIPSACGGKGTCGVCKVKVRSGGGALLPTETSHISRGEAREGVRLSCQVKVKQDMQIEIPAEVFSVRRWQCTVRSNHKRGDLHQGAGPRVAGRRRSAVPGWGVYPNRGAGWDVSPTPRSTSRTSIAPTGIGSSYGDSRRAWTNRSRVPTRWRTTRTKRTSSC